MRSGTSRWLTTLAALVIGSCLYGSLLASSASAAGTCANSTPQYCPVPVTGAVGSADATNHSVVLAGYVNPEGAVTNCTFQYGTTNAYGLLTVFRQVGSGTTEVVATATINGLQESTTFHYRLLCFSGAGYGIPSADNTFTTLANPATTPSGPSKVSIVNATGFVSGSGTVGLFISCFGSQKCAGTFTIKQGGKTIASAKYSLRANAGGPVNAKLSKAAFKALKKKGVLSATARAADSAGPSSSRGIHLHLYH